MNAITLNAASSSNVVDGLGWIQRRAPQIYTGMEGLLGHLQDRSAKARTVNAKSTDLKLAYIEAPEHKDDVNKLALVTKTGPIEMTHWSFGQLCGLAKAPVAFMRELPAMLVANNIEYCMNVLRKVEDVKVYRDDNELRAITGPGYGRIDDAEVVSSIQTILDDGRWQAADKHMGLRATDRSLQMFLIDKANPVVVGKAPNGNDDVMYRGLRISNSEVGYSSLAVDGFFFRSYCLNGMIFGMKDNARFTIRHSSMAPQRWAREIQPAIEQYAATDGMKLVEAVNAAKEAVVAKDDDAAVKFLNNMSFSLSTSRKIIELVQAEEGTHARSAWSMVQGITAHARSITGTEERADMERAAGNVWMRATRSLAA